MGSSQTLSASARPAQALWQLRRPLPSSSQPWLVALVPPASFWTLELVGLKGPPVYENCADKGESFLGPWGPEVSVACCQLSSEGRTLQSLRSTPQRSRLAVPRAGAIPALKVWAVQPGGSVSLSPIAAPVTRPELVAVFSNVLLVFNNHRHTSHFYPSTVLLCGDHHSEPQSAPPSACQPAALSGLPGGLVKIPTREGRQLQHVLTTSGHVALPLTAGTVPRSGEAHHCGKVPRRAVRKDRAGDRGY